MSQGSKIFLLVLVVLLMLAALGLIIVLVVDGVDWSFLDFEDTTEYEETVAVEELAPDYVYEEPLTQPDTTVEVEPIYSGELLNAAIDPTGTYEISGVEGSIVVSDGSGGIYPVMITLDGETIETVGMTFGEKYFASLNPADSTLYLVTVDDGAINGYYINPNSIARNSISASVDGMSFTIQPFVDILFDEGQYSVSGINASGSSYSDNYYLEASGVFFFVHRGNPEAPVGVGMLLDDYLISVMEGYLNLYLWNGDYYEGIWVQYPGDKPGSETLSFVEST
ncbi:hypothetical protein K8R78_04175 [bacterium]|nr:hypothetical protein [bacterium]